MSDLYPENAADRDRWILARRDRRIPVSSDRPYAWCVEEERTAGGHCVPVATIFLTNRDCPWRCVFCDLWRNTLPETVPLGAIPAQIDFGLGELRSAAPRQVKLYNAGSFFDPRAIPPEDLPGIARRVSPFERVVVECHPSLVDERVLRFQRLLPPTTALEVAIGLETAHAPTLARLNKRMTLADFDRAARFLRAHGIDLRVFLLVRPPFQVREADALYWAKHSVDYALESGAAVTVLIPTRGGNGALEALANAGQFAPPGLQVLEDALDYGLSLRSKRVFADTWDLERFASCPSCVTARKRRIDAMNRTQTVLPRILCAACGSSAGDSANAS